MPLKKEKLLALIKDEKSLFLMVWFLIAVFLPFNEGSMTNWGMFVIQSFILFVFTASILRLSRQRSFELRFNWLEMLLIAAIIWSFITLIYSSYRYSTFIFIFDLIFLGMLYFSFKLNQAGEKSYALIFSGILATSLVSTIWAYYEYLKPNQYRVSAGFLDPNYLATLMNIALSILIVLILFSKLSLVYRLIAFGFAVMFFITLLMTKSRGGFLSFMCILLLTLFLRNKKLLLIPIVLLILLIIVPNPLRDHIIKQRINDIYAFKRLDIWRVSFRMIADRPILGFSPGNYNLFSPAYNFPVKEAIARYGKIPRQAHNSFLQWSVEMGLPGIILLIIGLSILFIYIKNLLKSNKEKDPLTIASITAIIAILIQSLFSNNLYNRAIMLYSTMLIYFIQNQIFIRSPRKARSLFFKQYKVKIRLKNRLIFIVSSVFIAVAAFFLIVFAPFYAQYQFDKAKGHFQKSYISAEDAIKGSKRLRLAIKLIPYHAYYHQYLANINRNYFIFSSNIDAFYYSFRSYAKAMDINPVESEFYRGRIGLYSALLEKGYQSPDTLIKIEEDFNTLIRLRPKNAFHYLEFAKFNFTINRIEQAYENLNSAIALEPNFIEARYYLIRVYKIMGDTINEDKQKQIYNNLLTTYRDYPVGEDLYLKRLLQIPDENN